jgi:hypothetical protein
MNPGNKIDRKMRQIATRRHMHVLLAEDRYAVGEFGFEGADD